ncbi:hypothetical protein [Haloarchaeobius sp. HME9146]|uniref:hypothetical protein n=1 Tax=Haloarchaeobius sp. HME9146 TaxID=2978732 RepID=UPI0021C0B9C9|nr:hypothetical protein [Haloarchaeobius sp. HME9146]MCT9095283.1 hypothetical protein [Haloarchaeobius sp. HME9146]
MGGMFDGIAGFADNLAGSTDEAVGRATDAAMRGDWGGVGDNLAGDVDDAVGRAIDAAQDGDWATAGDNLGGGFDEWWATNDITDGFTDTVWSGHDGDTIDLFGPTAWGEQGSVVDYATDTEGEQMTPTERIVQGGLDDYWWVLVAVVVLIMLAPYADLANTAAGGGS